MENIKANQLRIGNYVYIPKDNNGLVKIYELSGFDIYELDGNNCEAIKPIPITEQWLLKFGFKKWGNDDSPRTISYEFKRWSIFPPNSFCDFKNGFGFMWFKKDENIESARVIIKYVHQLQNLYFALTGEELTFKSE